MKRIVNPSERWHWRGGIGKNPLGIRAKIEGSLSFSKFESNVLKLVKKYPILKAKLTLDEENQLWFDTENGPDCIIRNYPKKENEDWIRLVENYFNTQYSYSENPITNFILLNNLGTSEIIVITSHIFIDGMSLIYLIRELLTLISNPQHQIEYGKLSTPLEELIPEPFKIFENLEEIRIPRLNKEKYRNIVHRPISIELIHLDKEEVNKLIIIGKKTGATLHSILSCLFLISFAKAFSNRNLSQIGVLGAANLRPYLAKEFQEIVGNYSTPGNDISFKFSVLKEIDSVDKFFNLIKRFNKKLKGRYEIKKIFNFTLFLIRNFSRIDDISIRNMIDKAEIGFALSNLGKYPFELKYGNYKLLELNEIADFTYPSLKFMINTVGDRLSINTLYKLDVFNKNDIKRFYDYFFKIFDF
jgi:hypothetical protein